MSLWWMGGLGATGFGEAEVNYPSLWSGGVEWNAADIGDGTQGYWQTSADATDRTGRPDISIAVGGTGFTRTIRSANWQLGRSEWLANLQPSSASFEVEGAVTFDPMDEVVIALMSDTTDQHSDTLWVGYVDDINETTETSGRVVTSVSCIDVLGRHGQAAVPTGYSSEWSLFVADLIERVFADVGTSVVVIDDSLLAGPTSLSGFEDGETVVGFLNRTELSENLNIFARGDGDLVIQRRYYDTAPLLDAAPTPSDLDGSVTTWTVRKTPTSVVNDWDDSVFPPTSAMSASRTTYGKRSFPLPTVFSTGYDLLIDTGLMNSPRLLLSSADVPITDLGDAALFLYPNNWVTLGSTTYQVLSVQHTVEPGRRWRVSITGDTTQPLLHAEFS